MVRAKELRRLRLRRDGGSVGAAYRIAGVDHPAASPTNSATRALILSYAEGYTSWFWVTWLADCSGHFSFSAPSHPPCRACRGQRMRNSVPLSSLDRASIFLCGHFNEHRLIANQVERFRLRVQKRREVGYRALTFTFGRKMYSRAWSMIPCSAVGNCNIQDTELGRNGLLVRLKQEVMPLSCGVLRPVPRSEEP